MRPHGELNRFCIIIGPKWFYFEGECGYNMLVDVLNLYCRCDRPFAAGKKIDRNSSLNLKIFNNMKKLFYAAAFAALALTGCSTEGEEEEPATLVPPPFADEVPVDFSTSIVEVTRGVPVTGTKFGANDEIGVYGIEKKGATPTTDWMKNVKVTNSDPAGTWTYADLRYFMQGYNYQFVAYAPYAAAWAVDLSVSIAAVPYTVSQTIADQKDLMFAYSSAMDFTSTAPTNEKVTFQFNHALSQVKFSVKTAKDYSAYTLKIKSISLADIVSEGTCNITSNVWTPGATTTTYTQTWTDKTVTADGTTETELCNTGDVLMLIPQNPKDKVMTLTVNISTAADTAGADKTITIALPDNAWVAAHAYNYAITLSLDKELGLAAEVADPTIVDWTPENIPVENK